MKNFVAGAVVLILTGCANMTPQQHDNMNAALQNWQNNLAVQNQQNLQRQQNLNQFMYQNRTTNCRSTPAYGGGFTTQCN